MTQSCCMWDAPWYREWIENTASAAPSHEEVTIIMDAWWNVSWFDAVLAKMGRRA